MVTANIDYPFAAGGCGRRHRGSSRPKARSGGTDRARVELATAPCGSRLFAARGPPIFERPGKPGPEGRIRRRVGLVRLRVPALVLMLKRPGRPKPVPQLNWLLWVAQPERIKHSYVEVAA